MSTITSTNATNTSSTRSDTDFGKFIETREDFLTILLAQLKHQDPLSPLDSTEFIDSIARLTDVEQSITQNAHLENIEALLANRQETFGTPVSYLDKLVDFESPAFTLKNGEAEFYYNLESNPEKVFVTIRDANGNVVRQADGGTRPGKNIIRWDGSDNAGNIMPDGEYTITAEYSSNNKLVSAPIISSGVVTGANFEDGDVVLLVGNIRTSLDKIVSIRSTNVASVDD